MPRKLKLYHWQGWRHECPAAANGGKATREIIATTSKAEARAASNGFIPLREICEGGSDEELAAAMANPHVILWHPIDQPLRERRWRRVKAKGD